MLRFRYRQLHDHDRDPRQRSSQESQGLGGNLSKGCMKGCLGNDCRQPQSCPLIVHRHYPLCCRNRRKIPTPKARAERRLVPGQGDGTNAHTTIGKTARIARSTMMVSWAGTVTSPPSTSLAPRRSWTTSSVRGRFWATRRLQVKPRCRARFLRWHRTGTHRRSECLLLAEGSRHGCFQ